MSYWCQKCGTLQKNGTPSEQVVVQTREKVYPPRQGDPGGKGHETVRELTVCPECAAK